MASVSVFSSLMRPQRPPSAPTSPGGDVPDLRNLNAALAALTDVFPDIQPDVFREMLVSFSEESRLQVVTEALLRHRDKWVRGRYRTPAEHQEQRDTAYRYKYRKDTTDQDTRGVPLALEDTFRSPQYKEAAKLALYGEFKGLSHSTIKAVLAEYNWSYSLARPTLLDLASNSWRLSITNFLMRRKAPSANDHPLVRWSAADPKTGRRRIPLLVKTHNDELNVELYASLIEPELARQRTEQLRGDLALALELNEAEAEEMEEMYDCECCFVPSSLAQLATCDTGGHYICFRCIRFAINAALYDQGWAQNIDTALCTLKCIAPVADDACAGCIPMGFVHRALREEPDGDDAITKLDERFTTDALVKSQLPLARCPFCPYAELDDLASSPSTLLRGLRLKPRALIAMCLTALALLELLAFKPAQLILLSLLLPSSLVLLTLRPSPPEPLTAALRTIHLKRRGLRFQCLSPTCRRASCISCAAPWHDPHTCFASQLTSLRLALERATTDAVKRTCPACNLAFVKSDGCNKLVCLCGYAMCYVCREGLAGVGYAHFCQHFRERPGEKCALCDKCDLYRVEDEAVAMRRAREKAEREWADEQGEGGEKVRLGSRGGSSVSWVAWVVELMFE